MTLVLVDIDQRDARPGDFDDVGLLGTAGHVREGAEPGGDRRVGVAHASGGVR